MKTCGFHDEFSCELLHLKAAPDEDESSVVDYVCEAASVVQQTFSAALVGSSVTSPQLPENRKRYKDIFLVLAVFRDQRRLYDQQYFWKNTSQVQFQNISKPQL